MPTRTLDASLETAEHGVSTIANKVATTVVESTSTYQLIMEGALGACPIETAQVRQGQKVCVLLGKPVIAESEGLEHVAYDKLDLVETALSNGRTARLPKGGLWLVEGPAQASDKKNRNGRTYPRKLWEKLLGEGSSVQAAIANRQMVGHLEHPADGRTSLKEAAIRVCSSKLLEDGTVWNQFELLSTSNGMDLRALTADGVRWGVSSRGAGNVGNDGTVSEDFELRAWDGVATPSVESAHPSPVGDSGVTTTTRKARRESVGESSAADIAEVRNLLGEPIARLPIEDRRAVEDGILNALQKIEDKDTRTLVEALLQICGIERAEQVISEARTESSESDDDDVEDVLMEHRGESGDAEAQRHTALQAQLSQVTEEAHDLRERLTVAEDLLAEMVTVQPEQPVVESLQEDEGHQDLLESIASAIEEIPALACVESALRCARNPSGVARIAAAFVPFVGRKLSHAPAVTKPLEEARLPTMAMRSEPDAGARSKPVMTVDEDARDGVSRAVNLLS